MTLECEVVVAADGTKRMRDRRSGEIMHPEVGPRDEPERLYVGASRLAERLRSPRRSSSRGGGLDHDAAPLVLLDVGLGAGSNALAAWKLSESLGEPARRLEIVSVDRSLAALELALRPEHAPAFGFQGPAAKAARSLLDRGRHESKRTTWRVLECDARVALAEQAPASADVVFWDPFSPYANPELWTVAIFTTLRRLCGPSASVHTYSRATATRSALLLAGFRVGDADVGYGKPGTIAAIAPHELARPLDRRWLERLAHSRVPFPRDAPADALNRIRALAQFAAP